MSNLYKQRVLFGTGQIGTGKLIIESPLFVQNGYMMAGQKSEHEDGQEVAYRESLINVIRNTAPDKVVLFDALKSQFPEDNPRHMSLSKMFMELRDSPDIDNKDVVFVTTKAPGDKILNNIANNGFYNIISEPDATYVPLQEVIKLLKHPNTVRDATRFMVNEEVTDKEDQMIYSLPKNMPEKVVYVKEKGSQSAQSEPQTSPDITKASPKMEVNISQLKQNQPKKGQNMEMAQVAASMQDHKVDTTDSIKSYQEGILPGKKETNKTTNKIAVTILNGDNWHFKAVKIN